MTEKQISKILVNDLGYKFNDLIDLKHSVSSIYTGTDGSIYPGATTRLNFVSKNGVNLVEVYYGKEEEVNGKTIFTKIPEFPVAYYSFEFINGFNLLTPTKWSESYKYGRSV